jgi:uridine kinase
MSIVVGISGPSCSGKSTLVELISNDNSTIHLDDYFIQNVSPILRGMENLEDPSNYNLERLSEEIELMKSDEDESELIYVEGFILFSTSRLSNLCDVKIFLNIPEKEIAARRQRREDRIGSRKYIDEILIPETRRLVNPTRKIADYVLDGTIELHELAKQTRMIISENQYFTID